MCSDNSPTPTTGGVAVPNSIKGDLKINANYSVDKIYLEEENSDVYITVDSSAVHNGSYEFSYEFYSTKQYRILVYVMQESERVHFYYTISVSSGVNEVINFPEDFTIMATNQEESVPNNDTTGIDSTVYIDYLVGTKQITGGDVTIELTSGYNRTYSVAVTDFHIDSTLVTEEYYYKMMNPDTTVFGERPITGITWNEAILFCNKKSLHFSLDTVYRYDSIFYNESKLYFTNLETNRDVKGYRLPTVAEWTYASKGGESSQYFWGDNYLDYGDYVWLNSNSSKLPTELENVAQKFPNQYGLYDMIGNGVEYCNDYYVEGSTIDSLYSNSLSTIIDPLGSNEPYITGNMGISGGFFAVGTLISLPEDLESYHLAFMLLQDEVSKRYSFRTLIKTSD